MNSFSILKNLDRIAFVTLIKKSVKDDWYPKKLKRGKTASKTFFNIRKDHIKRNNQHDLQLLKLVLIIVFKKVI